MIAEVSSKEWPTSDTSDNNMSQHIMARLLRASRELYAVRRLLVSRLLSRKTKLRIWNVILFDGPDRLRILVPCDRSRLLVFENRVLRIILGPV